MRTVTIYINGNYSHTLEVNKHCSNSAVYDWLTCEGYKGITVVG